MKMTLAAMASAVLLAACAGGTECTTEPQSAWMPEEQMKQIIAQMGYRVNEFKISGSCSEIYGWDNQGRKVEVYFNPVSGDVVKSEVD